jgi:D-alanine-D-alanine ligase
MKKIIGLTYDLKDDYINKGYDSETVAELDSIETINAIDEALQNYGYQTIRIGNIFNLVKFLNSGKKVDLVFNICEGLNGPSREAQVPSILEAYSIDCVFSSALVLTITLNKALAKTIVKSKGVLTPKFSVINNKEDIENITLNYPLFIKPLYGGTGIGISNKSIVNNYKQLQREVERQLNLYNQPILVETFLTGREFTVGIIGEGISSKAIGSMEILIDKTCDDGIYSYKSKSEYLTYVKYSLIDERIRKNIEEVALSSWRALGCRDGGRVDLKMDDKGNVYFLEVNPLAGLHPIDSDLPILCSLNNISYQNLIELIMDEATLRLSNKFINNKRIV